MGYQNQERPDKLEFLIKDLSFDFDDLIDDAENSEKASREDLYNAIQFMRETFQQIRDKVKKVKKGKG